MRRFILLCIIALFVLSGLQLVKAALATEPDFSTALSGGYTLALSLQGDDSRMTANEESQEEYGLATRTTYHFMIYERKRDSGELKFTLYTDSVAGTL